MVTDDRFFAFIKYILHQLLDLDLRTRAMTAVLKENYENFQEAIDRVQAHYEEMSAVADFRSCIDTLELTEIIEAFEKYKGPIQ